MTILNAVPGRVTLPAGDNGGNPAFPSADDRPQYVVIHNPITDPSNPAVKYRPGVYHCYMTKGTRTKKAEKVNQWVCGPLEVIAITWEDNGWNFGRLLEFQTTDGDTQIWNMPMEILKGSATPLCKELLSRGFCINHDARKKFFHYVASMSCGYTLLDSKGRTL